jgi:alpha-tubulin suppressor-like RCC1 family protein
MKTKIKILQDPSKVDEPHVMQRRNSTQEILLKKKKSLKRINTSTVQRKVVVRQKSLKERALPLKKKKKVIKGAEEIKLTPLKQRFRYNICGWGWNSSNRVGNLTEENVTFPRPVQRSNRTNYISAYAGKNHSLFVSEEGNIYSIGDGRRGQLGYGNMFTGLPTKGGIRQATPLPITPTGELKFGRDLQCVQVAAGGSFSIAREATPSEGSLVVNGFLRMESSIIKLLKIYPDSESLKRVWCYVRHERFIINRKSEGLVITWGTGKHGELGLGQDELFSSYPQVNFRLLFFKKCISHISTGERHVLAIDSVGYVYSWGSGRSGRLGHGDFEDRYTPEQIKYFQQMIVLTCSAGDAHSGVLAIARENTGDTTRKILCFGRGAHGRLGYGSNRNMNLPVIVKKFPLSVTEDLKTHESLSGLQFEKISCGGAHTVVLAYRKVEKCLAFPFGYQTFILAWGYGRNGQLGSGNMDDAFLPVKCRLPKAEIIVEISTGRSWSIARSVGGVLYTWGKGLRGQLGQGTIEGTYGHGNKFSYLPRQIDSYGSFLSISSSFSHNIGITTPKKLYNLPRIEYLASKQPSFNPFTISQELLTLKRRNSISQYQFYCCKRTSTNQSFIFKNIAISLLHPTLPAINTKQGKSISHKYKSSSKGKSLTMTTQPHYHNNGSFDLQDDDIISTNNGNYYCQPINTKIEQFEEYRFTCLVCSLYNLCYYCYQLCHKSHDLHHLQKQSTVYFYQKRNEVNEDLIRYEEEKKHLTPQQQQSALQLRQLQMRRRKKSGK